MTTEGVVIEMKRLVEQTNCLAEALAESSNSTPGDVLKDLVTSKGFIDVLMGVQTAKVKQILGEYFEVGVADIK